VHNAILDTDTHLSRNPIFREGLMKRQLLLGAGLSAIFAVWVFRWIASARRKKVSDEAVETASEESFPASDAPSWTGTRAAGGTQYGS
jgi:hypothetical protein